MTVPRSGLRARDRELQDRWRRRFDELPVAARDALRDALLSLRADALARAQASWAAHKAPMALYWKVVGVYAGHLARALRPQRPAPPREAPSVRAARPGNAGPSTPKPAGQARRPTRPSPARAGQGSPPGTLRARP